MIYNDLETRKVLHRAWHRFRGLNRKKKRRATCADIYKSSLYASLSTRSTFRNPLNKREKLHNALLWRYLGLKAWRKKRNKMRNRTYGLETMEDCSDSEFKSMMRLDRATFEKLLSKISKRIESSIRNKAVASSGSVVTARTKLFCTLRWLAGGNYLDICHLFGVGKGTFFVDNRYGILWPTISAIDRTIQLGFPIDQLGPLAEGFARFSNNHMTGCVMAIDGWLCPTRAPYSSEAENINTYYNRHQCYGLVVLAGCDADLRFNMFSICSTGSTNDCLA